MSVLILAEHDQQQIKPNLLNTVTAAQQISETVDVLIVGHQCQPAAQQAASIAGVHQVLVADNPCYEFMLAENTAKLLQSLAKDYDAIICAASNYGKNVMPRLAALLDVAQISDVVAINEDKTLVRPIYAGNALETVQSLDNKLVLTVRSTAFSAANMHDQSCEVIPVEEAIAWDKTEFIKHELTESERPELTNARVVISGGRGLQSGENFQLLEKLADKLGAAIGASRAAVDAGFVPNDYQVGQTGKVVAPELYIAIGISGAIQHVAGMKDSKVIVAINKDEDAPIFNYADYGLVGDLFEIIPELINQLD